MRPRPLRGAPRGIREASLLPHREACPLDCLFDPWNDLRLVFEREESKLMRALVAGFVLVLAAGALAGCGGSGKPSAAQAKIAREAALYEIEGIEKTFHEAATTHNVNLMMSLFAPGAVFNIGTETYTGLAQIRKFFATKNAAFMPQNHWEAAR